MTKAKTSKPKASKPQLGTISEGTLNPHHLIPAFRDALHDLTEGELPAVWNDAGAWENVDRYDEAFDAEAHVIEGAALIDALIEELNALAPAYAYFGTQWGDGADFGFWLYDDWQQQARDDGALEVSDTSEIPADFSGLAVHVNDHGNATLYSVTDGEAVEVWSIV